MGYYHYFFILGIGPDVFRLYRVLSSFPSGYSPLYLFRAQRAERKGRPPLGDSFPDNRNGSASSIDILHPRFPVCNSKIAVLFKVL